MRKHYVTFQSPGTLFHEETTREIAEWDPRLAVAMAETVVERHGAKPFAFRFSTRLAADPVPDGEGGHLEVREKEVAKSGRYFLGGKVLSYDNVKDRNNVLERDHVLLSNMRGNGWWFVVENDNSWRVTLPFEAEDAIVGPDGSVERGDLFGHVLYREMMDKKRADPAWEG